MKPKHLLTIALLLACVAVWAQNKPKYSYTYQMPLPNNFYSDKFYITQLDLAQFSPDEYAIIEQLFQQLSLSKPEMDSIPRSINDIVGIKAKLSNPITRDSLPKNLYIGNYKALNYKQFFMLDNDFLCKFVRENIVLQGGNGVFMASSQSSAREILVLSPNEAVLKQYDLIAGNTLAPDERWINPPSYAIYYTYKQHFLPITLVSDKLKPAQIAALLDQKIPRWEKVSYYKSPRREAIINLLCAIKSRGYLIKDEDIALFHKTHSLTPEARKALEQFQKDHNLPVGSLNMQTYRFLGLDDEIAIDM